MTIASKKRGNVCNKGQQNTNNWKDYLTAAEGEILLISTISTIDYIAINDCSFFTRN